MATYADLMAQAQALMAQAEEARKKELTTVIEEIKARMDEYGITLADLQGTATRGRRVGKPKLVAPAKYRGPDGQAWAGGSGRKPEWVRAVLAAGQNLEDFRI